MAITGLVLTGGGARGAYQVGALKGLAQVLAGRPTPFQVITGASAGAINCMSLGVDAEDFPGCVEGLEETWLSLTPDRIFRTDVPSLFSLSLRWLASLTGGGTVGGQPVNHMLDTEPLRELLLSKLKVDRLPQHIRNGTLRGLALSATNYATGTAITFYEASDGVEPWARTTRLGRPEMLTVDHVLASCAIPLFFPPVRVGDTFYGDGCVRLTAPLSPAIHLGAERLVAISIRYPRSERETSGLNAQVKTDVLTLADISGVLMNAVFLDSLESDVERLERVNRTLGLIPQDRLRDVPHRLRRIPALVLRPSRDLGALASKQHRRLPAMLRYLLSGLGVADDRGAELISYLAFERDYVEKLIDLGYRDTLARADEVRAFLSEEGP